MTVMIMAQRRLVDILSHPFPTAYYGSDAGMNDRPLQFNGSHMAGNQGMSHLHYCHISRLSLHSHYSVWMSLKVRMR